MEILKPYPSLRVLFCMSLSPGLVGFVMGFLGGLDMAIKEGILSHFWFVAVIPIPFILYCIIAYGVASFILGVTVISINLSRGTKSYICIFILGGVAAVSWSYFLRFLFGEPVFKIGWDSDFSFPYIPIINDIVIYALGSLSAFIMALLVLPKAGSFDDGESKNFDASDSEFHDEVLQFSSSNLPEQ